MKKVNAAKPLYDCFKILIHEGSMYKRLAKTVIGGIHNSTVVAMNRSVLNVRIDIQVLFNYNYRQLKEDDDEDLFAISNGSIF